MENQSGNLFQGHCRHDTFLHFSLTHIAGLAVSCHTNGHSWPVEVAQDLVVRSPDSYVGCRYGVMDADFTYTRNGIGRTTCLKLIFFPGSPNLRYTMPSFFSRETVFFPLRAVISAPTSPLSSHPPVQG
ncbi:hypothetical protein PoB_001290300 [Plakobranchus ocellatus]|uniref:Uncharacterized protein n=1 Tax=Plakobranchus ocellatus TaxID=259542 RepID=A0AAV3YVI6_9GAST|nr:hypothetical protein PoB_001290300 [Plakobranchus ocellatus]